MQKLIIQDIAKMNDDWYAVCFHEPKRPHHAMTIFLARQPKEYAYCVNHLIKRLLADFGEAEN
jgi:hypothetical protein